MIVSFVKFDEEDLNRAEQLIGEKIVYYSGEQDAEKLTKAEVLITWGFIDSRELKLCAKLKLVFTISAGVEKLPFNELAAMGVQVSNASGIHTTQMAEQGLGVMIAFSRRLHDCIRNQLHGVWNRELPVGELTGRTLCIVGAGKIGQELARKARAFDMRITGLKKHARALPDFDEVWDMGRFHEALALADYVVLLTPLTDETFHLFGAKEFALMKKTAVFINMSRGDTVDEPALIAALRGEEIGGAGLDVFHKEPLGADSPFWGMQNVIITPHDAGLTPDYLKRVLGLFVKNYVALQNGSPMPNLVNLKLKY